MVKSARDLEIDLHTIDFMREVIGELAGTLQDVIGFAESQGFVSLVGRRIGERLLHAYRVAWDEPRLDREQVADALVDLKRRIDGGFRVVEQSDEEIRLENSRCPFGSSVHGRPTLCMMTSNVFGTLASENLGYARVSLDETIAEGHGRCCVRVRLRPSVEDDGGREYYAAAKERG